MQRLLVIALGLSASAAFAASPRPPLGAAEVERVGHAVRACTGGVVRLAEGGRVRTPAEHAVSLPAADDDGRNWTGWERADDVYVLAHALLVPALPDAERARDRKTFITCPANAASGVRLLAFLAGERPRDLLGPSSTLYWLGEAYRRGAGVPRDLKQARDLFLKARIMGQEQLIAADWGERADQPLVERLAQPAARAWLEEAAALPNASAQHVLADLVLPADPARSRRLLEAAVAQGDLPSVLRLGRLELDGRLGPANPGHAAEILAARRPAFRPGSDGYTLMIEGARRYDGSADIPLSARRVTTADVGGEKLQQGLDPVDLGSEVGFVQTRALIAPDGRVLWVGIDDEHSSFALNAAALRIYRPERLPRLAPEIVNGRAVFAWVKLPRLVF